MIWFKSLLKIKKNTIRKEKTYILLTMTSSVYFALEKGTFIWQIRFMKGYSFTVLSKSVSKEVFWYEYKSGIKRNSPFL